MPAVPKVSSDARPHLANPALRTTRCLAAQPAGLRWTVRGSSVGHPRSVRVPLAAVGANKPQAPLARKALEAGCSDPMVPESHPASSDHGNHRFQLQTPGQHPGWPKSDFLSESHGGVHAAKPRRITPSSGHGETTGLSKPTPAFRVNTHVQRNGERGQFLILISQATKASRFLVDGDGLHGSDRDVVDQTQKAGTWEVVRKSGPFSARVGTRGSRSAG